MEFCQEKKGTEKNVVNDMVLLKTAIQNSIIHLLQE